MPSLSIQDRFNGILARIDAARKTAIAPAESTTLVAVTKSHASASIRPVLALGHRVYGENRVQEAARKWPSLKAEYPETELHMIGPLQTNKVREALSLFDVVQSLDRPKLAHALADEIGRSGRAPSFFIQVNIGDESQKAGVPPSETPALLALCKQLALRVVGLMCIPPVDQPAAPYFALLREIAKAQGLPLLSMGMSSDFETAIRFSATHVRVGTAIFGPRSSPEGNAQAAINVSSDRSS